MIQMADARPLGGPGALNISPTRRYTTTHEAVELETRAAYLDGYGDGIRDARVAMGAELDGALAGPNGYGLETASVGAKEAVRRMLRQWVGVE